MFTFFWWDFFQLQVGDDNRHILGFLWRLMGGMYLFMNNFTLCMILNVQETFQLLLISRSANMSFQYMFPANWIHSKKKHKTHKIRDTLNGMNSTHVKSCMALICQISFFTRFTHLFAILIIFVQHSHCSHFPYIFLRYHKHFIQRNKIIKLRGARICVNFWVNCAKFVKPGETKGSCKKLWLIKFCMGTKFRNKI